MNEHIDDFLNYIMYERKYSNYTEKNYLLDLERYEVYLNNNHLNYKKITYNDISLYIKYLKEDHLNSASISRHLSSLRSFYNFLLKEEIIKTNPFKLINSPKKAIKLPNFMKYDEFEQMIDVCENTSLGIRNRALLEILLATGARIGEIVSIKVADISFNSKEIKVLGKGRKERVCFFGGHCENSLKKYLATSRPILLKNKQSDILFINHIGGPLTDRGVRDIIDNIIKKCSINTHVTPHTFRHTFATMLLNEGCDIKSVQELLGHANISTTSIYTHVSNDYIKDIYLKTHPRAKK